MIGQRDGTQARRGGPLDHIFRRDAPIGGCRVDVQIDRLHRAPRPNVWRSALVPHLGRRPGRLGMRQQVAQFLIAQLPERLSRLLAPSGE